MLIHLVKYTFTKGNIYIYIKQLYFCNLEIGITVSMYILNEHKWYIYLCFNGLSFIRSMCTKSGAIPCMVIWGTPTPLSDALSFKIRNKHSFAICQPIITNVVTFTHVFSLYLSFKIIFRTSGWLSVADIGVPEAQQPRLSKYQYLENTHQSNAFNHTLYVSTNIFYFM